MPHKFNAARRHKFDKAQYRVINWAEYNESQRQRGDLTSRCPPKLQHNPNSLSSVENSDLRISSDSAPKTVAQLRSWRAR